MIFCWKLQRRGALSLAQHHLSRRTNPRRRRLAARGRIGGRAIKAEEAEPEVSGAAEEAGAAGARAFEAQAATAAGKEGQALGLIGHCRNCGHRDPEVDQGSLKPRWAPPHLAFAPYSLEGGVTGGFRAGVHKSGRLGGSGDQAVP